MAEPRDDARYDALERWLAAGDAGAPPPDLEPGVAELARRLETAAAGIRPEPAFAAGLAGQLAEAAQRMAGPGGSAPAERPVDATRPPARGIPDRITADPAALRWLILAVGLAILAIPLGLRACAPPARHVPPPPTGVPSATWTAVPATAAAAGATAPSATATPTVSVTPARLAFRSTVTAGPTPSATATRTAVTPGPGPTAGRSSDAPVPTATATHPTPTDTAVPTHLPTPDVPPSKTPTLPHPTETRPEPTTPVPPTRTPDSEGTARAARTATALAKPTVTPRPSGATETPPAAETPRATYTPRTSGTPVTPRPGTTPGTPRPNGTSGTPRAEPSVTRPALDGYFTSPADQAPHTVWLPIGLVRFAGPFGRAGGTPPPGSATATAGGPTDPPAATPAPTAAPNRGKVNYPTDPNTIVLQLGWSDTEQPGLVWEEMNGTPYFTLYGDGRVIAGKTLFDWPQGLYTSRVDPAQIQNWLQTLTYDLRFFFLPEAVAHPDTDKYALHVYIRYAKDDRDFKRVSIGGFPRWLRTPLPDRPDAGQVAALARWVKDLEAWSTARAVNPYAPLSYTVISNEILPRLPSPPSWPLALDIQDISDKAPDDPSVDKPHGPPGHRTVEFAAGGEVWTRASADAKRDWPGFNLAAEYAYKGKRFAVGARQEVPGGSPFLPPALGDVWYREDK